MAKVKFTRENIVNATYDLMKQEGMKSISARKIAKKLKVNEGNKIFAFPKISKPWTCSDDKNNYYENLDNLMDYFEVDLIEGKRPYIRQHQLRRFFAMAFFWSKGFKSIDTLRWFLGHTNPEHVYHYIQENTDGAILNNVKAQYIAENIKEYANLESVLKEKFNIQHKTD